MYKLGLFLSILILFIVLVGPVKASQLYEVDVSVDVVDKDASLAREKAMVAANRQGLINLLKKIDRADSNSCFTITSNNKNINIRNDLDIIANTCGFEVDLFFQHNSSEYVSALMLNSFSFDCMNNDKMVSDKEKYYYLNSD